MRADIEARFDYHPPLTDERKADHQEAREAFRTLAGFVDGALPDGREKALALTKLEEGLFWANAAIARQDAPRS
jgi:hypothetical protein